MEKYTDYILWIYLFTLVIKNRKKPKKKKKITNSYKFISFQYNFKNLYKVQFPLVEFDSTSLKWGNILNKVMKLRQEESNPE